MKVPPASWNSTPGFPAKSYPLPSSGQRRNYLSKSGRQITPRGASLICPGAERRDDQRATYAMNVCSSPGVP